MQTLKTKAILLTLLPCFGILFACFIPRIGFAKPKVIVAPVRGETQYPGVAKSMRYILMSDLERGGKVEIIPLREMEGVFGRTFSLSGLKEISKKIYADVVVMLNLREDGTEFDMIVRAYELNNGFNIGSEVVHGDYNALKNFQDVLAEVVHRFLFISLTTEQLKEISKGHTDNTAAVQSYGRAYEDWGRGKYVEAASRFSIASRADPKFELARHFMQASGNIAIKKEKSPTRIGRALELVGKLDQAMASYSDALKRNPGDVEALMGQGRILVHRGKYGEALGKFQKCKNLAPKDTGVRIELAKVLMKTNNQRLAFEEFKKAKELGGRTFDVHSNLGKIYWNMGNRRGASREYLSAASALEKDLDYGKARQYYSKASNAQRSVEALQKQANILLREKQYQAAITVLKKASFIDPGRDSLYSDLGYAYYLAGQYKESFEKFRRAYSINNKNYKANLYLGILYKDLMEDNKTAITYLNNAIRISAGRREPYTHLAEIYQKTERLNDAISLLSKLVELHPTRPEYYKELADLYVRAQDVERGIKNYKKAIELKEDYVGAWENLGLAYKALGRDKEALDVVEKLYSIDASNNMLVKGRGAEFLSGMTRSELVGLARAFPKQYSSTFLEKIWVNNVAVLKLEPDTYNVGRFLNWIKPYRLDLSRIKSDLELALYSQYRVIRKKDLPGGFTDVVKQGTFHNNDESMRLLANGSRLDGLFGFEVPSYKRGDITTEVVVDLKLFTPTEGARFEYRPMGVKYLGREILTVNPKAGLCYAIIAIILGIPFFYVTFYRGWVRGRGTLIVKINYDAQKESFLTLRLATKEIQEKDKLIEIVTDKAKHEKEKYRKHLRQKGSLVRNMVGKHTVFERIPAREYLVYLFGTIEDTALTKKTVGKYSLMQKARVTKNGRKEIFFQLEKEEAFVKVFVNRGETELSGVELKLEGSEDVRYSKAGVGVFFDLKVGKYTLKAAHEGKPYRKEIEITSLDDRNIHWDLDEEERDLVRGGDYEATAVQMIRAGDIEGAAAVYKKHGNAEKANRLYIEFYQKNGMDEKAAELYQQMKEYQEAAGIYNKLGEIEKTNRMYGLHFYYSGDYKKALEYLKNSEEHEVLSKIYEKLGKTEEQRETLAMQYLNSGQKLEAAMEFEKAENWGQAGEIYESLNDFPKAGYMYAKNGDFALAGELFAKAGDRKRAAVAFEKAKQYDAAIMFYRELGEKEKIAKLLEKQGKCLEAAREYCAQGLLDEAIKICQKVDPSAKDYNKITVFLGLLFQRKGINDLALKSYDQAWSKDPKAFSKNSLYDYALMLEKTNLKKAQAVYEFILRIDLHFKDTAQRLNAVKIAISKQEEQQKIAQARKMTVSQAEAKAKGPSRYQIMEELGRGAMGVVYKARDTLLDRVVAYKTLPTVLKEDEQALESLLREAKTVAQLSHPNIVTLFDIGMENGVYYITMEYVQGKTLDQVLKKVNRINQENFLHIAKPLCDVLSYAHKKNVVHRDIKPSNIILFPDRGVKLMDFGIAKVLDKGAQKKTMMRGTPLYMAPEQITGDGIDPRTDIYALGVTFYEMLSGAPPFTQGDVMYAHVHVLPRPLSEVAGEFDRRITEMVMQCLAKDKNARFGSADEVGHLLGTMIQSSL